MKTRNEINAEARSLTAQAAKLLDEIAHERGLLSAELRVDALKMADKLHQLAEAITAYEARQKPAAKDSDV